jgi:gliding motility-associated lipoprotein GldH
MKSLKLLLLFPLALLSACDPSLVSEQNISLKNSTWPQNKPVSFTVNISDSLSEHNLYINTRHAGNYQYSNLFLFIRMTMPKGQVTQDTVECTLADPSGKWLGDGIGDIYENQNLFKERIRFPQKGSYRFEVEQAMRIDPLQGIMDVGLRVEKAE